MIDWFQLYIRNKQKIKFWTFSESSSHTEHLSKSNNGFLAIKSKSESKVIPSIVIHDGKSSQENCICVSWIDIVIITVFPVSPLSLHHVWPGWCISCCNYKSKKNVFDRSLQITAKIMNIWTWSWKQHEMKLIRVYTCFSIIFTAHPPLTSCPGSLV